MFRPKFFTLLKDEPQLFTPKRILADLNAGLIVAFIAIPLSIALGIASGVMPGKGLITAVVAGFLISFFGGSRVQIGGPTGAFVIIVYGIIQTYGTSGLITATAMAGIFLILMGIMKLGRVIRYIPYPVVVGFTNGIAVVLFSTQINDFFGMNLTDIPAGFIAKWQMYLSSIQFINPITLIIGICTILLLVFYPKRFKFFPAPLAALVITTLAVSLFKLPVDTIHTHFGDITSSMAFSPEMPALSFELIGKLFQPALTIAVLAGIESLLSAVVADGMIGSKHNSNTELIAQGMANIGSSIFGGIPATGAIARTAANINNGGRTPIAGMAHAVFILIIMLAFMKYIVLIPMVTLAAILFTVAYKMVDWKAFTEITKAPFYDTLILLTTFSLTVFADLVYAIEIGMILAAFLFMKRMSDITHIDDSDEVYEGMENVEELENKKQLKDVVVYEINGPFFFGAANTFIDHMEKIEECKVIILRMRKVPVMDATGYHALYKIYKRCIQTDTRLIICQIQKQPLKVIKNYGFIEIIGKENFALNIDNALIKAEKYIQDLEIAELETELIKQEHEIEEKIKAEIEKHYGEILKLEESVKKRKAHIEKETNSELGKQKKAELEQYQKELELEEKELKNMLEYIKNHEEELARHKDEAGKKKE